MNGPTGWNLRLFDPHPMTLRVTNTTNPAGNARMLAHVLANALSMEVEVWRSGVKQAVYEPGPLEGAHVRD